MKKRDAFKENLLQRLSSVRFRTIPEIRTDLPDVPANMLSKELLLEYRRVYKALNELVRSGDAEVRMRHIETVESDDGQSTVNRAREEYKLKTVGGKRKRTPQFSGQAIPAPEGT